MNDLILFIDGKRSGSKPMLMRCAVMMGEATTLITTTHVVDATGNKVDFDALNVSKAESIARVAFLNCIMHIHCIMYR